MNTLQHKNLLLVATLVLSFAEVIVSCQAQHPTNQAEATTAANRQTLLPASDSNAVVYHHAYCLEYSEADEQPRWVAYMLCRSRTDGPYNRKTTHGCQFRIDEAILSQSATPADYKKSGYSRGHLVPAADMKWDSLAQVETFLLSNISPQRDSFNSGVWNRMEMQVRRWAEQYDTLYIVTGPLLADGGEGYIGDSHITIPTAFYKAIYIPSIHQTIAFLIPHKKSKAHLKTFALSIDSLETITGINFFPEINDETVLEASMEFINCNW